MSPNKETTEKLWRGTNIRSEVIEKYPELRHIKHRNFIGETPILKSRFSKFRRECARCGKVFYAAVNHPERKYCNHSCSVNHSARQEMVDYSGAHWRVCAARGRPRKCEVCGKDDPKQMYDWANLTGNYLDVNDYKRMCRKCHAAYDKVHGFRDRPTPINRQPRLCLDCGKKFKPNDNVQRRCGCVSKA